MSSYYRAIFLTTVWTLILCSLMISGCASSSEKQPLNTESLYDKVLRTGKIRCAYAVFFPSCIKDPNTGKLSGIGVDAIEMVAKNLV